ncbi:MAG: succinate-semialdehyde dehydrogenase [Gammaproteobacteria bacterium]|jgi:succinate-semialdehyde dehydrogenase/glutarate-semialdehyde dehydrogenase|nr:succinate-semialdehyde dehydrogenase [Gammaproteobacteria bacterium]
MHLKDKSLLKTQAYIDGAWVDADDGAVNKITNPSTGETIAEVAKCGAKETERAVDAAERAQKDWARRTAKERSQLLRRFYDLMMENEEDLGRILTAEQGKPLAEARGEIAYGAAFIEWFSEEAKRINGDTIPGPSPDKRIVTIKQPVGVVACITPWNFPNAMLTRKIGPALAAGCTVVCKPANATPLSAFAIAELAERAGIPKGVVNVLAGKTGEIGDVLTGSHKVRKLTFTGSTEVGKELIKACAVNVKRTSMELGGNAPFIVFDDADLDAAVEGAIQSKYRNAGQTCVCANRLLVQSGVYEAFSEKLAAAVRELKLGDGFEEGVKIGPLIDANAANDVLSMVEDAVSRGAELVLGGKRAANGDAFIEPAILTGVTREMRVFNEEIFGPVAPLVRFDTEEEAIELANDTPFGLASYFYARDVGRIWRVSEGLEYGIVGVNAGLISNEMAPFGGVKESGNGREGSKYGIDDYVEIKYLCLGGI